MKIRNLDITLDLFGLMISITPFRYARPAFKTHMGMLTSKRTFQLFFGPLHVWHFAGRDALRLGIEAGLNGKFHGTFTPIGENVFAFLWHGFKRKFSLHGH